MRYWPHANEGFADPVLKIGSELTELVAHLVAHGVRGRYGTPWPDQAPRGPAELNRQGSNAVSIE